MGSCCNFLKAFLPDLQQQQQVVLLCDGKVKIVNQHAI